MLHAHASMYTKHGPSLIEVCFEISIFIFIFFLFLACSWVVYNRSISSCELIVVVINPL